jgi:hypothetical protein
MARLSRVKRWTAAAVLGFATMVMITLIGLRPDAIGMGPRTDGMQLPNPEPENLRTEKFWAVQHERNFARSYTQMRLMSGKLVARGKNGFVAEAAAGMGGPRLYRSQVTSLPVRPPEGATSYTLLTAGWPFATLRGTEVFVPPGPVERSGITNVKAVTLFGIPLPRGKGATPGLGRNDYDAELPTGVNWAGVLLNTATGALAWSLPLIGAGWAQAMWRRRKGLCAVCAYDLRGQVRPGCPECGSGREEDGANGGETPAGG